MARPAPSSALYHPLDQILGTPAMVRVTRVLAAHGGSLGVADIARRARLALPSTRAAISRLLESEVVTAIGAGRSMVCTLDSEHPLSGALVNLFASEQDQADAVLDAIRAAASGLRPPPLAVWLYGSVARSEDDSASDIDIALVSSEGNPSSQAETLREAIAVSLPRRHHRVSVISFGPEDVRQMATGGAPLWRYLEKDAVVLAGDAPAGVLDGLTELGAAG